MASKKQQIEEIKAVQGKVNAGHQVVEELKVKLSEIETAHVSADVAEQRVVKLINQKEDIQADISLGVGKQKDLDKVNVDIAQAESEMENQKQVSAGLRRKLSEAEVALDNMKSQKLKQVRQFIEREADELHSLYMEQAEELLVTFRQLLGLADLSKKVGGNPLANDNQRGSFMVPLFRVESTLQHFSMPGYGCCWSKAADIANAPFYLPVDEEAERARLAALGIQI